MVTALDKIYCIIQTEFLDKEKAMFQLERTLFCGTEQFCDKCPFTPQKFGVIYRDMKGRCYCCIECATEHKDSSTVFVKEMRR